MKKVRIILIALVVMLVTMFVCSNAVHAISLKNDMTNYVLKNISGNTIVTFRTIYDDPDKLKEGLLYCIRGSKLFPSNTLFQYLEAGNMKTNASSVITKYNELNSVNLDRQETINDSKGNSKTVNIYNAILWIMDNSYLPKDNENYVASEYREELLNAITLDSGEPTVMNASDDDIQIAQQAAIWFFTDYDTNGGDSVSFNNRNIANYIYLNENNDWANQKAVNSIYNYFIDKAIENASSYGTEDPRGKSITPPELEKGTTENEVSVVSSGSAYYIGPFKIDEKQVANIDYTAALELKVGNNVIPVKTSGIDSYSITSNTTEIAKYATIKDAIGKGEFYIRVPNLIANAYNVASSDIKLSVTYNYSYYETTEIMLEAGNDNQAVVLIERNKIEAENILEWSNGKTGEFSLNLTKVKTGTNTKLAGAKFKLVAGTWDESTETFTATGTETEFGPTGGSERDVLKLIENQTITQDGTYKPGTYYFRLTESVTPAGYLGLENPIIIKIVITENTNGFTISSKLINEDGNEVTSIQGVANISVDSTTNTISLTVENKEVVFDLALRKYITGLQTSEGITKGIYNKEGNSNTRSLNNIDVTPLNTGRTTADYNHRKDPVVVETGDIVTYTLRVYNEGDIDGYVTEIKDILPEGLEFYPIGLTEVESTDANIKIWKQEVFDGYIPGTTITTTYTFNKTTRELVITREYHHHSSAVDDNGHLLPGTTQNYIFNLSAYNPENTENGEFDIVGHRIPELSNLGDSIGKYGYYNGLNYGELSFKCKVTGTSQNADTVLTNVARITGDRANIEGDKDDRDSEPQTFTRPSNLSSYKGTTALTDLSRTDTFYTGQQDDDDFEKLVILGKKFDLSLRKFITTINGEELDESRLPELDMTPLETGSKTTARYIHPKEPVVVKQGDIVTYTIRVYNEGSRDGYVTEVTDYIPEGLGLIVGYSTNNDNNWHLPMDDNGKLPEGTKFTKLGDLADVYKASKNKLDLEDFDEAEEITSLKDVKIVEGKIAVTSNLLQDSILKAYDSTKTTQEREENWQKGEKGTTGLYYEDIEVTCIVLAPNSCKDVLKNIAEITGAKDENGTIIKNVGDDRDSEPKTVNEESYHNSVEDRGYFPGEQDDDDFEPLILQYFDLALRKFITGVNQTEVTSRIPKLSINEETGNIKYTHPKEEAPVEVQNNDEVTYTIRIFNEGTKAGYADLVADDIPEGLVFLPENKTNKEYRWVMYKEVGEVAAQSTNITDELVWIDGKYYVETDDPEEADMIQTDYLSLDQGEKRMQEDDEENPALLQAFDPTKGLTDGNPDYKDLKVVFKVTEPNTSDRIIVNSAQITHDTDERGDEIDDDDSETNEWNEGEDDQDKEYIKVKYFDLSLYKWVTETIVTVDEKTTTTETGFIPNIGKTINVTGMDVRSNDEAEPIAGVVLDKRKLNRTTVKFVYSIMVMNEGEIAGSATEITDYIPEGLEFVEEDNTAYGWEYAGDGKIITRCLDGIVLEPGESKAIEVVFTWINSQDNLGLKTNIAEISEDFNESGTPDIDSVPNNKYDEYNKEQEDDDDFALVILQLETGSAPTYVALVTAFLAIIAAGTFFIKKYVL